MTRRGVTKRTGYSKRYDSLYSRKTGRWLESKCGSPTCTYCKDRPARHHARRQPKQ